VKIFFPYKIYSYFNYISHVLFCFFFSLSENNRKKRKNYAKTYYLNPVELIKNRFSTLLKTCQTQVEVVYIAFDTILVSCSYCQFRLCFHCIFFFIFYFLSRCFISIDYIICIQLLCMLRIVNITILFHSKTDYISWIRLFTSAIVVINCIYSIQIF
jgi:hypothetical protein